MTPDQEQFLARVYADGECWIHPGTPSQRYATVGLNGKVLGAHVLSYRLFIGETPSGRQVAHTCNNKRCVNPEHLYLCTPKKNAEDAARDGRYPTGDDHWTHRTPERLARGDKNGARLYPERLARGDDNPRRKYRDRYPIGERHPAAKLTNAQRADIPRLAASGRSHGSIARELGVDQTLISRIVRRSLY